MPDVKQTSNFPGIQTDRQTDRQTDEAAHIWRWVYTPELMFVEALCTRRTRQHIISHYMPVVSSPSLMSTIQRIVRQLKELTISRQMSNDAFI